MTYYEVLGVTPDADNGTIKKAFHTLSKKYHPDLNPTSTDAEDKFKRINEAYSVLSDEGSRQQYDVRLSPARPSFGGVEDLFKQFFGSSFRRPAPARPPERTLSLQIPVSRLRSSEPVHTQISFEEEVICGGCGGVGGEQAAECSACEGNGHIEHRRHAHNILMTQSYPCHNCGATGRIIDNPCNICDSIGTRVVTRAYRVTLTAQEIK